MARMTSRIGSQARLEEAREQASHLIGRGRDLIGGWTETLGERLEPMREYVKERYPVVRDYVREHRVPIALAGVGLALGIALVWYFGREE